MSDYEFSLRLELWRKDSITQNKTNTTNTEIAPRKGTHSYAVEIVQRLITYLGYTRVVLKSDQEPARIALKEMVRNTMTGCTIIFELPPLAKAARMET